MLVLADCLIFFSNFNSPLVSLRDVDAVLIDALYHEDYVCRDSRAVAFGLIREYANCFG